MTVLNVFGQTVRNLRKEKGFSQEVLASRAGFHRTYIGSIERGERNVTLKAIVALAGALDVSPEVLVRDIAREQ